MNSKFNGHSRTASSINRPGTLDTASDMSTMLRKYKIVILGEQSSTYFFVLYCTHYTNCVVVVAGKTSLITRFVYDSFDSAYQVKLFLIYYKHNDNNIKLLITIIMFL